MFHVTQRDYCRVRVMTDCLTNPLVLPEEAERVTAFGVVLGNSVDQCVPCPQRAVSIPDGVDEDAATADETNSYM